MKLAPLVINSLWLILSFPRAFRLHFAIRNSERAQRKLLKKIIRENSTTWFGHSHGFPEIKNYEEFRSRVPAVTYSEIEPLISRTAIGEKDALIPGLPLCFEPTSGSTSGSKLIPYTPALQRDFQNGIAPWINNMFRYNPSMLTGSAYWSISPAMATREKTAGGIPVGFESDLSYLHPVIGKFYSRCLAVPVEVSGLTRRETFRYTSAAFLLADSSLRFVSVWNPTFFLIILSTIEERWKNIVTDLESGKLTIPPDVPETLADTLQGRWRRNPERAEEIRKVLKRSFREGLPELWPGLRVISCWADGAAALPAHELESLFPGTKIIPKGLLATEGFVSLPLEPYSFPVLSVTSHFFEFASEDGEIHPSWDLEEGKRYSVLLTTGGGLYRYRLEDIVEVAGFAESCPLINFIGRSRVSDLFGEKIHESHVAEIVKEVFEGKAPFAILAPTHQSNKDHYILYASETELDRFEIRRRLEEGLCKNPHYLYCRQLGQLNHAEVCLLPMPSLEAHRCYLEIRSAEGIKVGDVKPSFLERPDDWYEKITEQYGSLL